MDVEAADELAVDGVAELPGQLLVPRYGDDRLADSPGERVRARGVEPDVLCRAPVGELLSKPPQRLEHPVRVREDRSRNLDDAFEELRLHALGGLPNDAREGGLRLERLRVDEDEFLLHAERPRRRRAEARHEFGQALPRTPWTGRPAASHA